MALTVRANLAMAQCAAGQPQDAARIADALIALVVQNLAERKPSQLLGGQAQRVALARVVLLSPAHGAGGRADRQRGKGLC